MLIPWRVSPSFVSFFFFGSSEFPRFALRRSVLAGKLRASPRSIWNPSSWPCPWCISAIRKRYWYWMQLKMSVDTWRYSAGCWCFFFFFLNLEFRLRHAMVRWGTWPRPHWRGTRSSLDSEQCMNPLFLQDAARMYIVHLHRISELNKSYLFSEHIRFFSWWNENWCTVYCTLLYKRCGTHKDIFDLLFQETPGHLSRGWIVRSHLFSQEVEGGDIQDPYHCDSHQCHQWYLTG